MYASSRQLRTTSVDRFLDQASMSVRGSGTHGMAEAGVKSGTSYRRKSERPDGEWVEGQRLKSTDKNGMLCSLSSLQTAASRPILFN